MMKKSKAFLRALWRVSKQPLLVGAVVLLIVMVPPFGNWIGARWSFRPPPSFRGYQPTIWPNWSEPQQVGEWVGYGLISSVIFAVAIGVALSLAKMASAIIGMFLSELKEQYKRELRIVEKAEAQGGAVTLVEEPSASPVEPSGDVPDDQAGSELDSDQASLEDGLRELTLHSWTDIAGRPISPALLRKFEAELAELRTKKR